MALLLYVRTTNSETVKGILTTGKKVKVRIFRVAETLGPGTTCKIICVSLVYAIRKAVKSLS